MRVFSRKAKTPAAVVDAATEARVTPPYRDATAQGVGQAGERRGAAPSAAQLTVGDYASGVPQIRVGAMLDTFRRQIKWMLPAILLGVGVSWFLTSDIERTYTGEARVLVQLGSEYVYNPVAGSAQSGLLLTPDHIVLNEVSIMTSEDVITRVMGDIVTSAGGWQAFEPAMAGRPAEEKLRYFERAFSASPRAKSSVIDLSFRHSDPEVAVQTVNAFLQAYKDKRRILFTADEVDTISGEREFAEAQLDQNERRIASLLRRNGISDFDSERRGATERTESLKAELNGLRASITETEASLRRVEDQLRAAPETINLQVDDRASQRVAQAELELKQLLARYLPTSDPVRQKRLEIEELRSLQAENGGAPVGGRRVGPNPVQQELQTRFNTLQSTANALREKEVVIQQQLNGADGKARSLRDLAPRMENLLRERRTMNDRLSRLNTKEQEALVDRAQTAQAQSENVRVIANADVARKGRNTRMIAFLVASLLWTGTVFLLGLLRTFLDPNLYARGSGARAGGGGGRRTSDLDAPAAPQAIPATVIPEPVAPYIPAVPAPAPAYAPAYAPAAHAEGATLQPVAQSIPQVAVRAAGGGRMQPGYSPAPAMGMPATAMGEWQSGNFTGPAVSGPPVEMSGPGASPATGSNNGPVEWTPTLQAAPQMSAQPSSQPSGQNTGSNPYMTTDVAQALGTTEPESPY